MDNTTYYGFYEFLQDDGIYANAFSSLQGNLIRFDDYSSSGGTQTTYLYLIQKIILIFPVLKKLLVLTERLLCFLDSGTCRCYNIQGEGIKKPSYDTFDIQATGRDYWTRSTSSNGTNVACAIYNNGNIKLQPTWFYHASECESGFLFA